MSQGMGFSVGDIPFISGAVAWADRNIQTAVEAVLRRYAEFERAAMEAPAIAEDAARARQAVAMTPSATAEQRALAERYAAAAQKLSLDVSQRRPVDEVVSWAESIRRSRGMAALPVIPVAIGIAAISAAVVVSNAIKSYTDAQIVRGLLAAGASPEIVAQWGSRRSPFSSGLFGLTSGITLAALALGGFILFKAIRK